MRAFAHGFQPLLALVSNDGKRSRCKIAGESHAQMLRLLSNHCFRRDGEGLGDAHMVRLWGGGRYDLTEAEVEGYWVRAISEGTGGVDNDQCLEDLMAQRWRCDEEEQLLEVPDTRIRKGHSLVFIRLAQINIFRAAPMFSSSIP